MSPKDVALLVGVPLSETSFQRAWDAGSHFLAKNYSGKSVEKAWSAYLPSARVGTQLCQECQELGTAVVLDATLGDLSACASRFSVVIVMTHMDYPRLRPEDVLHPQKLINRVREGSDPELDMLRRALPKEFELDGLIEAVNRLCGETHRDLELKPVRDLREAEVLARHRRPGFGLLRFDRPRFDELVSDSLVQPGRGIEFSGAMVTAAQFVSAFPVGFSGMADLRMCNSISVGATLRRARPDSHIAVGKRQMEIEATLVLIKTALTLMARRIMRENPEIPPLSYQEAMDLVAEAARWASSAGY